MAIPVKLPKEVLNLFPTWEYCCPDCSTYVESNISFCPNCKTAFNEKRWRVPPKFLKNYDSMSEYAHRVLAPKLTQKQRELLFKYFTELFSDGFESGDFSAWTGYGANTTVVGSPVHHGSYAAQCAVPAWDWTGVRKDLATGHETFFVRHYRRYPTLPTGLGRILSLLDSSPYTLAVEVYANSSTLRVRDMQNSNNYDYSWSPSVDTWYCLEVKIVCNTAVAGELRLWLDGSEVITQTGLDLSGTAEIDRIVIGQRAEQSSSVTTYIDCVVVADTYIGQEGTGQTYTKTWATDVLFKKLGITETLSVDAALQKQDIPKTFGLDSAFQKSILIQNQIDALFKRFDIPKSFAVDAHFGALITQIVSRQIDVLLKKLDATATFGLDAYFGAAEAQAYTETFGLDVVFAYKVRLPELWLDENGQMVLNISKPYVWVGT